MTIFFKKTETPKSLEYEFVFPKVLFYVFLFTGILSLFAFIIFANFFKGLITTPQEIVLLALIAVGWGFILLVQLNFWFVRFAFARKIAKYGGSISFSKGSTANALIMGRNAPMIFPGQKIRWEK